ncbi:MAG: hypothetical protein GY835_09410, partial [bacterium]|nr:hypothetical protein [bacterium]
MHKSVVRIFMLLLILPSLQVGAEVMSIEEAGIAASNFMIQELKHDETWGDRATAEIADCREIVREGRLLGYWTPIEPRGFIIVSLLKELPAIKAWSTESNFDPTSSEGLCDIIMDRMSNTLMMLEESKGSLNHLPKDVSPAYNRAMWEWLVEGKARPMPDGGKRERIEVGPLLECQWDQGDPYNDDCPIGHGGERTIVGCTATAAAMVMLYWRYPEYGAGSAGYEWDGDNSCGGETNGEYLIANYNDQYDWDNILDNYADGYNADQAAAVAELSYEIAVAFRMKFGRCSSSAIYYFPERMYPGNFRYQNSVQRICRQDMTADEYWAHLKREFTAEPPRVIHYMTDFHAMVCDGFRNTAGRYYHMNYGWRGGNATAWYAFDDLYISSGIYYPEGDYMFVGIEPEGHFPVSDPGTGTVWRHGETLGGMSWSGCDAATVKVNLYKGNELVAMLVDWTTNTGSASIGTASSAWGTGPDYRLKVIGDDNKFGYSELVGIFGAGSWADGTAGPLGDAGNSQGVAWGDCDGNGDLDIYLTTNLEGNKLFVNNGGPFSDVTAPPIDVGGRSRGACWGDYDNDGDLDLFVCQTSGGANFLFRNDAGVFVDVTHGPLSSTSYSLDACWGDYDGDGDLDLYVVNTYAADQLLRNDEGTFVDATVWPLGDGGNDRSANWVDFDNDGD